jgi:hypothetical protein
VNTPWVRVKLRKLGRTTAAQFAMRCVVRTVAVLAALGLLVAPPAKGPRTTDF